MRFRVEDLGFGALGLKVSLKKGCVYMYIRDYVGGLPWGLLRGSTRSLD